ncbi:FxLYD domain-containing protein [Butyrivibrio sp. XPD2002]|uniref:FxLYD domain-containing protein n=1 Tax=Butyrivibrio sp. XPD2002 TaxID=1280665 RepID=UPI000428B024|nr:FxLYD domain-containing protein [Butyrivibrio sp. XPD2002]
MKYAFTTFALIVTLLGGFIFGAYYMYRKNNPLPAEQVNEAPSEEEALDNSEYYDSDGNWIFKYNTEQSGYGGSGALVVGGDASENIDYRITGTNFVYEDDGLYSGFHAVVTIENIGKSNLYLGTESVFDIEDRNLEVVDSYDYVRAVPDVIAPGEKGYFYVPYGQIKTREDSVTIEEGDLSGDTPNPGEANSVEGNFDGEDVNSIDIEELEKALEEEGLTTSSIKVEEPVLMAAAKENGKTSTSEAGEQSGGTELLPSDESGEEASKPAEGEADSSAEKSADTEKAPTEGEAPAEGEEVSSGDATSPQEIINSVVGTEEEKKKEKVNYPGLSLYRVHEYFIMPNLDVKKCANDPRSDFDISNIMYGSNTSGYFTLSADVSNSTDKNVDYIPVTVVALDRRGNAIAVGKDSITDFYSGATRSFGVSYILTREQRSNIVQCVVYAREAVSK